MSRRARRVALAGLPAVVGLAAWMAWGPGEERSVEATVRAFFEARQAGDCEHLVGLLTEESWSEGGRLERGEFVDRCGAVVDDYRPALGEVEVVSDDGDQAVVNVAVDAMTEAAGRGDGIRVQAGTSPSTDPRDYELGRLRREDGDWKVETDHLVLRIGRSVEQTVRGFVDTFNDGDCEQLVDYVSEDVWSAGGQRSRADYVEQCVAAAEVRQELLEQIIAVGEPRAVEVSVDPDEPGVANARWEPDRGYPAPSESVPLVREGGEWKLDGTPEAVEQIDVAERLVLDTPDFEIDSAGTLPPSSLAVFDEFSEGGDVAERRAEAGFQRGAVAKLRVDDDDESVIGLGVALYEFETDEGASAYAELLADRIGQQADASSPVLVPSVADVRAAILYCSTDDDRCQHAAAAAGLAVAGRFLTVVEATDYRYPDSGDLTSRVEEVLHAQLDRL